MAAPVGFIGLGNMGRPMAENLVKHGFSLVVHDVQQVYQMARAAGLNKQDGSAIFQVLERLAGVGVAPDAERRGA